MIIKSIFVFVYVLNGAGMLLLLVPAQFGWSKYLNHTILRVWFLTLFFFLPFFIAFAVVVIVFLFYWSMFWFFFVFDFILFVFAFFFLLDFCLFFLLHTNIHSFFVSAVKTISPFLFCCCFYSFQCVYVFVFSSSFCGESFLCFVAVVVVIIVVAFVPFALIQLEPFFSLCVVVCFVVSAARE